jgi:hypothetical protein
LEYRLPPVKILTKSNNTDGRQYKQNSVLGS